MANMPRFKKAFQGLTGHVPFPWQQCLYDRLVGGALPKACDIPTGLGKTAVIPIWLLALATQQGKKNRKSNLPRRLVYVVNRRTVVDQATREAEQVREALRKPELMVVADALRSLAADSADVPLAISTLRGQFADNAEWRNDPARPAVIVGTVDMIGSRLLFGGYGCGFKSRPLHAGLIGQDALLVHDEAHLEPAFQKLISAVEREQQRCGEYRRFHVMALTATSREGGNGFTLTGDDLKHEVVRKRIKAKKGIAFCPVDDEKVLADEVAQLALKHKDSGRAILVFLRKLEDVGKVKGKLEKQCQGAVRTLTGTLRGLERDALAQEDPIFARFRSAKDEANPPAEGTVYLVCTSAGEVGINISADHLVCDLTPFDSMAQRLGRVNRFGDGNAQVDVAHVSGGDAEMISKKPYERACAQALPLLMRLPKRKKDGRYDAGPAALAKVQRKLSAEERRAAFTPHPAILPTTEILFDAWALTSVRERLPGRPPVADWLHGIAEWEPPETRVAWREEVELLTDDLPHAYKPDDLLNDYPLKPHELLRGRTDRVTKHLEKIAERCPDLPAWLVDASDGITCLCMSELVEKNRQGKPAVDLSSRTVLLAPRAGGLKDGLLDGALGTDESRRYDIADMWYDQNDKPRRRRVWEDAKPPAGMRLVRIIDTKPDADEEDETEERDEQAPRRRFWHWYVRPRSADDDGSWTAPQPQPLNEHTGRAGRAAKAFAERLSLEENEAVAVEFAARRHDLGKSRHVWQRSIRNSDYPKIVLAKSGGKMRPADLGGYRHEFGSLIEVSNDPEFRGLEPEVQDLVLHMIATHHGRARPHFTANEAFDPEHTDEAAWSIAREVPRRFARLQRKYGRWGLAYLESLVRAADVLASQPMACTGTSNENRAAKRKGGER